MKIFFPIYISLFIIVAQGCSDPAAEKRKAEHADSLKVLPTTVDTLQQSDVTRATGEVMIAFRPMASEFSKFNLSSEDIKSYDVWVKEVVEPIAKASGRAYSSTDDDNIMVSVSKSNRFTIQRSMYPEPFGLIITKDGQKPVILHELASREKIEAALK